MIDSNDDVAQFSTLNQFVPRGWAGYCSFVAYCVAIVYLYMFVCVCVCIRVHLFICFIVLLLFVCALCLVFRFALLFRCAGNVTLAFFSLSC